MSQNNNSSVPSLVIPSAILAAALIISSAIAAFSIVKFKTIDQTVFVTGSARRRIKSDLAIWRISITREAPQLVDAYRALSKDTPKVEEYLRNKGVTADQMTRNSIVTTTLKEQRQGYVSDAGAKVIAYRLSQSIVVSSKDVEKVASLARQATELIEQNIMIDSDNPQFYCRSLGDLKQGMLADAAKDAQVRAKKIAESTGSKIGPLRSAHMGALQITPPDSTDVSDSGISDTSTIEKDITAVVNVSFALD